MNEMNQIAALTATLSCHPREQLPNWNAGIHAGYRSVTGTARLRGQSALGAIRNLVDGSFAVA